MYLYKHSFREPVEPAINTCGIFAISVTIGSPAAFFPSANDNFDFAVLNSSLSIISLSATTSFS